MTAKFISLIKAELAAFDSFTSEIRRAIWDADVPVNCGAIRALLDTGTVRESDVVAALNSRQRRVHRL